MAPRDQVAAPACPSLPQLLLADASRTPSPQLLRADQAERKPKVDFHLGEYPTEGKARARIESALTDDEICPQDLVDTSRCSSAESSSKASVHDYAEELSPYVSTTIRKVEMDKLAIAIACAVQFKLQTCQHSGYKCVRLHPVQEYLRNVFLDLDFDRDGKLTRSESYAFCQHLNLPPEKGARFFNLMDGYKTGFVNWEAFLLKYAPLFNIKS